MGIQNRPRADKRKKLPPRDVEVILRHLNHWLGVAEQSLQRSRFRSRLTNFDPREENQVRYYRHAVGYLRQMIAYCNGSVEYDPVPEVLPEEPT